MERAGILAIALLAALAPLSARAVDNEWISSSSGLWTNVPSWNQGRLPIASDRVFIYKGVTVTVDNAAANLAADSFTNTALYLYNVSGTPTLNFDYTNTATFRVNGQLNMGNATLNWNAPNATFHFNGVTMNGVLGTAGPGEMNLLAGTWYSPLAGGAGFTLAAAAGSSSVLNIHSNASLISLANSNNEFGSGGFGQVYLMGGTLNLGAAVVGASAGSTGRIVMTSGNLVLTNAGQVFLGIGSGPGSGQGVRGYGELIVSNGSFFSGSMHNLAVGAGVNSAGGGGRGVMQVFGGTHTNFGYVNVGMSHNSTGTVLLAGGTWQARQTWRIGSDDLSGTNSFGSLTVSNGTLRTTDSNIHILLGNNSTGHGELKVADGSVLLQNNSFAFAPRIEVGVASGGTGRVHVTGGEIEILGSNSGGLLIATNTGATGSAILEGGIVRLRRLDVGAGGVVSNRVGGVLQFLGQDTVTGTGAKIVDGGTLSYKGYSALNVTGAVAKFTVVSGSGLQLDSSTNVNSTGAYTLTNAANNMKALSLTGTNPRWNSDSLLIASGAKLHVSNAAAASVSSVIQNSGTIQLQSSSASFEQDISVAASGAVQGDASSTLDFKKSFLIQSTNHTGFALGSSTVLFSGSGDHTNSITGVDRGTNTFVSDFSYGKLRLDSTSDHLYFTSGDGASSNALYVTSLDLLGASNNVANLHAPAGIHVYYLLSEHNPFNAYLFDQTYTLDGGGLLLPAVPEPSALAMLTLGGVLLAWRRWR